MSAQVAAEYPSPTGRTAWARNLAAPVRDFLSTETGGAAALLFAALAALVWANSPWPDSYESVWTTNLSIRFGNAGISEDLRVWVNEGLMTFFFLVLGPAARGRRAGEPPCRPTPPSRSVCWRWWLRAARACVSAC